MSEIKECIGCSSIRCCCAEIIGKTDQSLSPDDPRWVDLGRELQEGVDKYVAWVLALKGKSRFEADKVDLGLFMWRGAELALDLYAKHMTTNPLSAPESGRAE